MNKNKCISCHSDNTEVILVSNNTHGRHMVSADESFDVCRCKECGSIFLGNIEVNDEYYRKYYELGYYGCEHETKGLLERMLKFFYEISSTHKERMILKKLGNTQNISILDVGCGNGDFLHALKNKRFIKKGLEINKEGCEICKAKGLDVCNAKIDGEEWGDEKFDVITMWHVLEHIDNPTEFLKKTGEKLSKNGKLIFAVPNSNSWGFKIGGKNWFHLDSPRHLMIPNRESTVNLLNRCGLKLVEVRNGFMDYPLDLFWSIRSSAFRFLLYPLYPLAKIFSEETLIFIAEKEEDDKA